MVIEESILRRLYEEEKKTTYEVAGELQCSPSAVQRALKKFGIPIRGPSECHSKEPEKKTCPCGIEFEVGGRGRPPKMQVYCSHTCQMTYNNPSPNGHGSNAPRPKKNKDTLHNEEWLRQKYEVEKLSVVDIARLGDCSVPSAHRCLRKFGIEARPMSEAKKGRPIQARGTGALTNSVERQRQKDYERSQALKLEMIAAYGGQCACPGCDVTEPAFLTLDHPNGNGAADRKEAGGRDALIRKLKEQGWPQEGYRLLCMNCNLATKFGRTCPHQLKKGL